MSQSHESLSDVLSAMVEAQPPLPDIGGHPEPLPEGMLRDAAPPDLAAPVPAAPAPVPEVPTPKRSEPESGMPAAAGAETGGQGAQSMGFPIEEMLVVAEPLGPEAIQRAVAESVPPDDLAMAQAATPPHGEEAPPTEGMGEPAAFENWPAPVEDPVPEEAGGFEIPYGETYGGAATQGAAAPRRPVARRKPASSDLREFAAPVCLTMGLLVIAPGVWSIMHLVSPVDPNVEGANPPPAAMIYGLLLSWPVSMALIAAGVVMIAQLAAEKKRAAKKTETKV